MRHPAAGEVEGIVGRIVRGHVAIGRIDVRAALETERACQGQGAWGLRQGFHLSNGLRADVDGGQTKHCRQVRRLCLLTVA